MSRNLVFQVDIKENFDYLKNNYWREFVRHPELYEASKISAMKYASKFNADYYCMCQPVMNDVPSIFQRLYFYELIEKQGYDKIFIIDCDAVVYDECPDIFEFDTFSAAQSCPPDQDQYIHDNYAFYNMNKDYKKFFNIATCMITRDFFNHTKDHWRSVFNEYKVKNNIGTHEMGILNVIAYKYYPHDKINILDDNWGPYWKNAKYVNHYGGYRKAEWYEEYDK